MITKRRISIVATAAALTALAAAPAAARGDGQHVSGEARGSAAAMHEAQVGPMNLAGWQHAELRGGFSAERLIGMHVRDRSDRSIGEIDNLLMTRDGRISGVIVSAGGVLGIGETYYRVPWQQLRFDQRTNSVSVPISKDNVERFRWGAEEVKTATNEFRVRDVLNGQVKLRSGARYGQVDDLIIGRNGRVQALVATSAVLGTARDRYAFPYRGEIFYNEPDRAFTLPYTEDDVANLQPLDYNRLDIGGTLGLGAEGRVGADVRNEQRY